MEELLQQFESGHEGYHTDPLFNRVVNMLVRGMDPITVIDTLLDINLKQQEHLKDTIMRAPGPPIMIQIENVKNLKELLEDI